MHLSLSAIEKWDEAVPSLNIMNIKMGNLISSNKLFGNLSVILYKLLWAVVCCYLVGLSIPLLICFSSTPYGCSTLASQMEFNSTFAKESTEGTDFTAISLAKNTMVSETVSAITVLNTNHL